MSGFASHAYWEQRYRAGGDSGAGSGGVLLHYKAAVINAFIADNHVASVLDLGCGDGRLLSLLRAPSYVGVDVSPTVLSGCASRFPQHRFLGLDALDQEPAAELALSIDVLFHLVEDQVFIRSMDTLFAHATRFVLIYASNFVCDWPAPHVRHRRFTDHVVRAWPDWRLLAHLPNPHPYHPARPDETSFADFFVYGRPSAGCAIRVPGRSAQHAGDERGQPLIVADFVVGEGGNP
ncbi:MAG TPA: methyltransferase domain-containing protein [Acetobacteraceae bacterium]|nr:methyltransferase domain-containing protein [Acetobacteraceae bacterium]